MPKPGYKSITIPEYLYNIICTISDNEDLSIPKTIEFLSKLYYLVRINPTDRERMEKLLRKARRMKTEKLIRMLHI